MIKLPFVLTFYFDMCNNKILFISYPRLLSILYFVESDKKLFMTLIYFETS
jgi:hypothetical protein